MCSWLHRLSMNLGKVLKCVAAHFMRDGFEGSLLLLSGLC